MCYFFLFYMSSPAIIMKYFIKIHEVMTVTEKESKFTLEYQDEVFPSAFY